MRELIAEIDTWRSTGDAVAIATVVTTWGSAPRRPGAALAIGSGGQLAGSVSGGCVEGAVIVAAREVIAGAEPHLLGFDVADDTAMAVGLPCGGKLEVFVENLADDPATRAWLEALRNGQPAARLVHMTGSRIGTSIVASPTQEGSVEFVGSDGESATATAEETLTEALRSGKSLTIEQGAERLFSGAHPSRDRLIIIGAVHIAQSLSRLSRELGYHITLVDARSELATPERFPDVDSLQVEWPATFIENVGLDASSDVVVLSHDDKLDDPAIAVALRSNARYVGALGSRKRTAARAERLLSAGVTESELDALDAPIGLDIGAKTPEEIALSILARMIEVRRTG